MPFHVFLDLFTSCCPPPLIIRDTLQDATWDSASYQSIFPVWLVLSFS